MRGRGGRRQTDPHGTDRRRPGGSRTRDAILDAATKLFAERGYDGASIRTIAGAAGVDPALIRHFFGDKDTLFTAVVADRTIIFERLAASLPGDPATLGHRVADTYLRLWEQPQTRPILMAIARSATTSDKAAKMLRDALARRIRADAGYADTEQARRLALAAHTCSASPSRATSSRSQRSPSSLTRTWSHMSPPPSSATSPAPTYKNE
jgi:AcrR family transcriptional regulator